MSDATPLPGFRPLSSSDLPIFQADGPVYTTFYTPGCLCVTPTAQAEHFACQITQSALTTAGKGGAAARTLRQKAADVLTMQTRPTAFQPRCLTLYLHNQCNLRCVYCFSAAAPRRRERLSLAAIQAAAVLVASACAQQGVPCHIGLHGGGEPSYDRPLAEAALAVINQVAAQHGVRLFRYIATNGVVDEETAGWLAHNFEQVGLSCDGPPDLQDCQRPQWNGGGTAAPLAKTARILRQVGVRLLIRSTITSASVARQAEVAAYLCQEFAPVALHFEPVYHAGRAGAAGAPMTPDGFVTHFLAARAVAKAYGVPLVFAGTRPAAWHGPFCNVLRDVVNLIPGDVATACFKATTQRQAEQGGWVVGHYDPAQKQFSLDQARIAALRQQFGAAPADCQACFNRFHCAYSCPEACPGAVSSGADFRCQVQRQLATALLHEAADQLWRTRRDPRGAGDAAEQEEEQVYATSIA